MTAALHRTVRQDSHTWITLARDTAWGEQGRRCLYCHRPLARTEATADHVIPRSDGGTNEQDNIVCACRACNMAKKSMSAAAFKNVLKSPPPLRFILNFDQKPVIDPQRFNIAVQGACRNINIRADRACRRIAGCLG